MKISEIFHEIQGESSYAGYPCSFIRLAGCNLECSWCDTDYTHKLTYGIEELVSQMRHELVEVTGGEPLIQPETPELIHALNHKGFRVLLETNGTKDIQQVSRNCTVIMDVKCPSSGEHEKFLESNLNRLLPKDEVKFVIQDRNDYNYAKAICEGLNNIIHFSPVWGVLKPQDLANWILSDNLPVRLHLQQHKLIHILSEGRGWLGDCEMGGLKTGKLRRWNGNPM